MPAALICTAMQSREHLDNLVIQSRSAGDEMQQPPKQSPGRRPVTWRSRASAASHALSRPLSIIARSRWATCGRDVVCTSAKLHGTTYMQKVAPLQCRDAATQRCSGCCQSAVQDMTKACVDELMRCLVDGHTQCPNTLICNDKPWSRPALASSLKTDASMDVASLPQYFDNAHLCSRRAGDGIGRPAVSDQRSHLAAAKPPPK